MVLALAALAAPLAGEEADAVWFISIAITDGGAKVTSARQVKIPAKPFPPARGVPHRARRFYEITGQSGEVLAAGVLPDPRAVIVEYVADGGAGMESGSLTRDDKAELALGVPAVPGMKTILVYERPSKGPRKKVCEHALGGP